ncbi:MAG: thiosulfate oxidation carrier protein SoxY [Magnetovibrio sp.]|nr:thiosulfate oxidation carrier protein SoxY [Magnetovibrio sp.]|tara:strand:- start:788 stop:1267 length:480 start_codon:yes stop_codon:yes gene_type:complete
MGKIIEMTPLSRRELLKLGGAGALALVSTALLPSLAQADANKFTEAIKKLIGDKPTRNGKIKLELPQIAENGKSVPMALEVESPMTDENYVKSVHVLADGNPKPDVASFHFTPLSGRAKANTRLRLAKTQNIVAIAEMHDGSVFMAKSPVTVTIGGCTG